MDVPENLRYTASHEWIADHGDGTVSVGITAVAADQLGELVYVELPKPGARYRRSEACAVVESTKAASDVYAPLAGEVIAVNTPLTDAPEQVNQDAYAAWFIKLKPADAGAYAGLLDPKAYEAVIGDA